MSIFDWISSRCFGGSSPEISPAEPLVDPDPFNGTVDGNDINAWVYVPSGRIKNANRGAIAVHGGWIAGLVSTYAPYVNMGWTTVYPNFEGEPDIYNQDPNRDAIELRDVAILMKQRFPNLQSIDLVGVSLGCYRSLRAFALYPQLFRRVVGMIGPINMHDPKRPYDWDAWTADGRHGDLVDDAKAFFDKAPDPMQLANEGRYTGLEKQIILIYGEKDKLCTPVTHFYPFIRRVKCLGTIIEGAAHNVHRTVEGQKIAAAFLRK
ncbi:hypothetical protein A2Z67_04415 [Candidatus Woesebacteria bacterium RBG_13_36_22]|uniref:Peptidase S9 prolyl oligopeptidase catalytic domain-containing protein n=1 Tax=Candidatus Woesebacteria bacterium RBG_13_36_22 TaxID=1802478 RepID=A0A1F7X265_9BACT|nr:MAG: hypothetical protein A2Z67_04415 [Candidatus Woesebacteria bacterium RBG_13_36_22]